MDQPDRMPQEERAEEDDDEYEYEYHDTEFETFLVDVDLSSLNPFLKRSVPGAVKPVVPAKRSYAQATSTAQRADQEEPNTNVEGSVNEQPAVPEPRDTPSRDDGGPDDEDEVTPFPLNVQTVDLSTANPIISYKDHVYSCTWTDMVGTNMFFTHPGLANPAMALRTTDDYDLIGTSRIKLVGHEAKLAKKARPKEEAPADASNSTDERQVDYGEASDGRSFGNISRSNPKVNVQIKKQASFLEKMMEIKRQRGENDVVRTFVDEKIASGDSGKLHEIMHAEIEKLNRQVVKGDADALARLQEIYSQLNDEDEVSQDIAERPDVGD